MCSTLANKQSKAPTGFESLVSSDPSRDGVISTTPPAIPADDAQMGLVEDTYQHAIRLQREGDSTGAAKLFMKNVALGHADSIVGLGLLHLDEEVPLDDQAMQWGETSVEVSFALFQRAADMGNPEGIYDLGLMYLRRMSSAHSLIGTGI